MDALSNLSNFEVKKGYAVFRPAGQISVEQSVALVKEVIKFARSLKVRKLLVDITNLTGFEPPGIELQRFLITEWARVAEGDVCVALVTKPEMAECEDEPLRMTSIAGEIGFTADVFTAERDAVDWLEHATTHSYTRHNGGSDR